jgi:hypothetical protein
VQAGAARAREKSRARCAGEPSRRVPPQRSEAWARGAARYVCAGSSTHLDFFAFAVDSEERGERARSPLWELGVTDKR